MANVPDHLTPDAAGPVPLISIIMANHAGALYIDQALQSAIGQSLTDIEVIVIDDASPDDSVARVQAHLERDPRIRLIQCPSNGGPARARNLGLEAARGEWIAILDSDDIMEPGRLANLLERAQSMSADIVADDLLYFIGDAPPHLSLFEGAGIVEPTSVSAEMFISGTSMGGGGIEYGYIKPLMRRATIGSTRYDETLVIGEDYDFILRLLLGGAKLIVVPEGHYHYRRHALSISHRLSVGVLEAMIASQDVLVTKLGPLASTMTKALASRRRDLERKLAYERFLFALRHKRIGAAVTVLARRPVVLANLAQSVRERVQRMVGAKLSSIGNTP